MRYPVNLQIEQDGVTVTFPDVPEAITCGSTVDEAMGHALDALESALEIYLEGKQPVPMASKPKRNQAYVDLPASAAASLLLYNELLQQKVRPTDLARRLGIPKQDMTRMLNPWHNTRIDTIAEALGELGKRLELHII